MRMMVAYVQSVLLKRYEYSYALLYNSISALFELISRHASTILVSRIFRTFFDYEAITKRVYRDLIVAKIALEKPTQKRKL